MFRKKRRTPDQTDVVSEFAKAAEGVRTAISYEFAELLHMIRHPWRLLWTNFLIGLVRGIGIGVGLTVLSAAVIAVLAVLVAKATQLPVVGEAFETIHAWLKERLSSGPQGCAPM